MEPRFFLINGDRVHTVIAALLRNEGSFTVTGREKGKSATITVFNPKDYKVVKNMLGFIDCVDDPLDNN